MYLEAPENYLLQIEQIFRKKNSDTTMTQEILQFIEQCKKTSENDLLLQEFYKGELAFYSAQYERALDYYFKARGICHFEFFCYRASAYIFFGKEQLEKALKFVKKSLEIVPKDYYSQLLFNRLDSPLSQQNEEKFPKDLKQEGDVMNADTSLYSFSSTSHPEAKVMLTQRLYSSQGETPYTSHLQNSLIIPQTLNHPVHADNPSPIQEKFHQEVQRQSQEIESAIQTFSQLQTDMISQYIEQSKSRPSLGDHYLQILHGWEEPPKLVSHSSKTSSDAMLFLINEHLRNPTGGFFLKWNQKGIAINPGRHFIRNLHKVGLHITDIDYVIATHENAETYSDIKEIYDLNSLLMQAGDRLHVIHYYLNQMAYQELSKVLKPNSKQERDAIHSLEFFIDSPEIETLNLDNGIHLHYFPVCFQPGPSKEGRKREKSMTDTSSLGIRLELEFPFGSTSKNGESSINFGYISGEGWSPFIGHLLGNCDLILAGLGNTCPSDYHKIVHFDDCLGLFDTNYLLEESLPKLLICSEFGGRNGDLRLEIVKAMRNEYAKHKQEIKSPPIILPADIGLYIDLKALTVKCSCSGDLVDASQINVVKSKGHFGPLHYLSRGCHLS